MTISRRTRLFLRSREDRVVARLVNALVESVGVEKLALLLTGISIIASNKSRSE